MVCDCADKCLDAAGMAHVSKASTFLKLLQHEASKEQPPAHTILGADCDFFSQAADTAFI